MSILSCEDKFEFWLMDMDDALERFIQVLPNEIADQLDYSVESLSVLEAWLLEKYENMEKIKPQSEAALVDGVARYIGETFRKNLGGKWIINTSDNNNAFYGLPQLVGCKNQESQICPIKLVSASIARRTGKFSRMVLENHL